MNNTIFWYWFKRITFITSICMFMYVVYTWISPEREFHTKYTNTEIIQIIYPDEDRVIAKWSGIDKNGIKQDFEVRVYKHGNGEYYIGNLCDVTLDDIKSGTVYIHKCGLFALFFVTLVILFIVSVTGLICENDLGCQDVDDLEYRLKHRITIAKYWLIFWGYPSDKVNKGIEIYKSKVKWNNIYSLNIGLINVIRSVNEIMKTN